MEETELLAWRKKYRGYRQGEERGAVGEGSGLLKKRSKSSNGLSSLGLALSDLATDHLENQTEVVDEVALPLGPELSNDTFAFFDPREGSWESLGDLDRADPESELTAYRRAYRYVAWTECLL